jgi:hypothetical protein
MRKIIYIIVFVVFTSCTKDISIDLDGHVSKLVVNCFFSPGDSLTFNISKSIPILETDSFNYIDNAEIEIYQDGSFIGASSYKQKGFYTIHANLKPEDNYTISVTVPGIETVTSHDTIPKLSPMLSFDTISIDSKYLYCEIKFEDRADIANYYLLDITSKVPVMNSDSIASNQVDILVTDYIGENGGSGSIRKRIYFSDKKIEGELYNLSFILDKEVLTSSTDDGLNVIYINFKTISKDYYTYAKTYHESQSRQMDVFTNIEDGYGIFAGYNLSQDSIIIQQ